MCSHNKQISVKESNVKRDKAFAPRRCFFFIGGLCDDR